MKSFAELKRDHRGEMTAIMGLIILGMLTFVIGTALTSTVSQAAKSGADNMDSLLPGNGGSGLIRLGGGTIWGIMVGIGILAVVLLKMFGYIA